MNILLKLFFFFTFLYIAVAVSFANNQKIIFSHACTQGNVLTIVAVGDILLHQPLQEQGLQKGFETLWQETIPYLQAADIVYGNLEGSITTQNAFSSHYPFFKYHPHLISALKKSGFDLLSTANNHALDNSALGVRLTIAALDQEGILYSGTRMQSNSPFPIPVIMRNGIKIAWISCTENTNGINDQYKQVLYCYKKNDREWIIQQIHSLKNKVDAIIVSPHWGEQYHFQPTAEQINFAHQLLNAGAIAVIGSHPHVVQPLQKFITHDGRETLILYSLGNFVSFQGSLNNRTSIILVLVITKNAQGTFLNGVRFIPLYMQNRNGRNNIAVTLLGAKSTSPAYQVLNQVLPMENVLISLPLITNKDCVMRRP